MLSPGHGMHYVTGQVRLPFDAGGEKAGTVLPAWRCLGCFKVELSEYLLELNHWRMRCEGKSTAWWPEWAIQINEAWLPQETAQGDLLALVSSAATPDTERAK